MFQELQQMIRHYPGQVNHPEIDPPIVTNWIHNYLPPESSDFEFPAPGDFANWIDELLGVRAL